MRRRALAVALVLAVIAGVSVGAALHLRWPDPFHRFSQDPATSAPTPSTLGPPPGPSTATGRVTAGTPGPGSSKPSPEPQQQPAFTQLALLTPQEFLQRGWGAARVVDRFDHLPKPAITPCATVQADQPGLSKGFAATYASERTEAAEEVARFDTTRDAADAYAELRAAVSGCADASAAADRLRVVDAHHPDFAGNGELRWWNTRAPEGGKARGVVALVRVDDRVAVLSLRSDVTDPAQTTEIESLLVRAGRRLV